MPLNRLLYFMIWWVESLELMHSCRGSPCPLSLQSLILAAESTLVTLLFCHSAVMWIRGGLLHLYYCQRSVFAVWDEDQHAEVGWCKHITTAQPFAQGSRSASRCSWRQAFFQLIIASEEQQGKNCHISFLLPEMRTSFKDRSVKADTKHGSQKKLSCVS